MNSPKPSESKPTGEVTPESAALRDLFPPELPPALQVKVDALGTALREESLEKASHVLRPLAALDELFAVCASMNDGRGFPSKEDRRSLGSDLQKALTALGEETRRLLQPSFHDFLNAIIPNLPDLLERSAGRMRAVGAARELRRQLVTPDGAAALWRDLVAAVDAGHAGDELAIAGSQLIEVANARGLEWRWPPFHVSTALRRAAFYEVETALREAPVASAQTAWFVFGPADIAHGYLRIGQVQFFSSKLWPELIRDAAYIARFPGADFPRELSDHVIEHELKVTEDARPHVYARVELQGPRAGGDKNPWSHGRPPYDWARDYVESLVQAATFRQGGSSWRLFTGGAVWHGEDQWSTNSPIRDPLASISVSDLRKPVHEGTGQALEELPEAFAERLAEGAAAARGAAQQVRWHESAQRPSDPAQRLALFVRGFELSLPIVGEERWYGSLAHYLRDFWALNQLADEVVELARSVERSYTWRGSSESLNRIGRFIEHRAYAYTVDLEEFLRLSPQLLRELPRVDREVRLMLRRATKWSSDRSLALTEVQDRQQQFDILLRRALRQRNAILHGVDTVPDVIATAEHFVAGLSGTLVATAVAEAGSSESVSDALERTRAVEGRRIWRLQNESTPVAEALFGEAR